MYPKRPHVLLLLLFLGSFITIFAQERKVSGTVSDKKTGIAIAGVSVKVKNSPQATVTDANGKFTIKVSSNESVISVSHTGYAVYETKVGANTNLSIALEESSNQLDEVVVVGYGTKKRANLLGAVAMIKAEDIEDLPVANLGSALVNRVPGLSVNIASGKPGATTTLTIRNPYTFNGSSTMGLTSDPLYVIDGLVLPKTDFDNLDATLIESISFLKDASAAIYGSAGAKGVVLVTTKKGKAGKAKINYSSTTGFSTSAEDVKTLSAYQHAKMLNDGYELNNAALTSRFSQADLDFLKTNPYQSWYDTMWKPASTTRHTINVSGGTEKITFFVGGNYYNEGGNYGDISINKYGIRSGMSAKVTDEVTATISLNTDYSKSFRNTLKGAADDNDDQTIRALFLTPKWVPLTIGGNPIYWNGPNPPGAWNPYALFASDNYKTSNSQGLTLNATLEYRPKIINGLYARVQFGKVNRSGTSNEYYPTYNTYKFTAMGQNSLLYNPTIAPTVSKITNSDMLTAGTNYANSYQLITSLGYTKRIKQHDFDWMVAMDQNESESNSYLTYRTGQQVPGVDQFWAFNAATTTVQLNGASEAGKRSYLTKGSYSYASKYLLEFSGRYDGSANFAPDKRWGFFPAAGLGWKVSDEKFFFENIKFINTFKLRVNYGLIGDDRVNGFLYKSRYTQTTGALFGTTVNNGLDPSVVANPNLTWEKSLMLNYGFDATAFNNKLTFSMDIWKRHTFDGFDVFSTAGLPYTAGVTTAVANYGIQNSWGTEFSVGYRDNITKDLSFNVQANFGNSDNQVIQSYYNPNLLGTSTEYTIMNGKSTNTYTSSNYGYIFTGILRTQADVDALLAKNPNYKINGVKPQVGFMNFKDINNDGVIDGNDITVMYDRVGSLFGLGLTLGLNYKTLKWSTNIGFSYGGKKFYDTEARKVPTTTQNAPAFWADHWTPDNPNAKYPRADAPLAKELSTFWAVDGTTARVNNMTLSYSLPKTFTDRLRIPEFRIFLTGNNLWNIINPYGYKDPNTSSFANYPTLRSYSLGLNLVL
jgi:TonB-linked SusC/RagA family outer membrane protein